MKLISALLAIKILMHSMRFCLVSAEFYCMPSGPR